MFNIVLNNAFMSVASRTCKEWGQYECKIHEALKAVLLGVALRKCTWGGEMTQWLPKSLLNDNEYKDPGL